MSAGRLVQTTLLKLVPQHQRQVNPIQQSDSNCESLRSGGIHAAALRAAAIPQRDRHRSNAIGLRRRGVAQRPAYIHRRLVCAYRGSV